MYKTVIERPTIEAEVPIDFQCEIGTLLFIEENWPDVKGIIITGKRFTDNNDKYTIYGVLVKWHWFEYAYQEWALTPKVCPKWGEDSGRYMATSVTRTGKDGNRIFVEVAKTPYLPGEATLYVSTTGDTYWACASSYQYEGNRILIMFSHPFASGTYTCYFSLGYTNISSYKFTVSI